jgi:hypothetical protein
VVIRLSPFSVASFSQQNAYARRDSLFQFFGEKSGLKVGATSSSLPSPESHGRMQFRLMLLGADTILAKVGVLAPAAADQLDLFADGTADGAGLQHVRNHMPGDTSPGFQHFTFFPNLFEFVVA